MSERDRQTSSMSDGSFFKWPKQPIPGQELLWVAHMERSGPSSRASLHCLPRYTSRDMDRSGVPQHAKAVAYPAQLWPLNYFF